MSARAASFSGSSTTSSSTSTSRCAAPAQRASTSGVAATIRPRSGRRRGSPRRAPSGGRASS
eukprot:4461824-Prymnesium_polylepis.1